MFVPSAESLMSALSANKSVLDGNGQVKIPARLLKLLLQVALAAADFDEESYLRENPDVAKAILRGEVESAHLHYIGFGYFEGRRGAGPVVDADWYLSKYPDVAAAVREGRIKSAEAHFHAIGGGEGRSPALEYESDAAQWKSAIRGL
ncbi:hypothetical protein QA640_34550 [Bradyrhizobium sp. CB82]|uniref:hypothetical protein n=1 Tax=Bradyrhizobium sp. CB82 TaxID=3039159 RepID=UPI0024B17241|nr:hypothetical protein [Bradyrhizobium sp. CB82]WFU39442.1 hypothetical protein QA640_34550 [Bradyrhizobium sp. CB82]